MRKLVRVFARTGQDSDVWPVVLLLFAVLVPAICLLWFMGAAMRNECFAARQTLADAYRGQLSLSRVRLEQYWNEGIVELETLARSTPPSAAFAKCLQSGRVDSVIIFDGQGNTLYPNTPSAPLAPSAGAAEKGSGGGELEPKWAEAGRLEYLRKDFVAAAERYDALAKEATNDNTAARALQAQVRCLVQAGRNEVAIRLVDEILGQEQYDRSVDPQGRLIAANAELMALELLTNHTAPAVPTVGQRLKQRLLDYDNPMFAASQRRFLMKELHRLSPRIEFPTLAAEELAAQLTENHPRFLETETTRAQHRPSLSPQPGEGRGEGWEAPDRLTGSNVSERLRLSPSSPPPVGRGKFALQHSLFPGLWQFTTPDRRVLAFLRSDRLLGSLQAVIAPANLAANAELALLPPDSDDASALLTLPAGEQLPGWRLVLSLKDRNLLEAAAEHSAAIYLWAGILVLAGIGVLALLAVRLLRRQVALARLKNDLAATVSHELKTPLSSMRVLVDTLLDSDRIEEKKAREYLRLIARENDRLSRVIQNFLTFSRMERRKHTFDFVSVSPSRIIDAAVNSVRERFETPGCRFEVQIEENLPEVTADPDALATALINLLDNAWKYTAESKHITLKACARNGQVVFSVRDNGIGIASQETGRIFQPFHQLDSRLSRKGSGCGLGLSIVRYIINAHRGSVSVESQPGAGSTFTLCLPIALAATARPPSEDEEQAKQEGG